MCCGFQVHCGFMRNGGTEMNRVDIKYAKQCRFVVASGIFDGYDVPHQPSNISLRSQKLFCFLMVVDEKSVNFIKKNVTVREDNEVVSGWVSGALCYYIIHPTRSPGGMGKFQRY